jgi:[ribosomal protein S5]-alanine N-acetyltransferase
MKTARLTLRPFTLDDAAFIVLLLNDPGWLRFIGDRQVRTTDDACEYLRNGAIAHAAKHGFALGAVQRSSDGVLIGMCGLIRREGLDDVDLGYAFLPEYRGQGYAREAAAAWLACGFERFGLKRIVAITSVDNAASGKVLESIGMRFEQRMRVAGHEDDSLLYAASAPDLTLTPIDHRLAEIAQAIHHIQMVAYAQEAALLGVPSLPPMEKSATELQSSDERFCGAYQSSTLIGAVGIVDKPSIGATLISSLVVHPLHQRKGVATAMLRHVLAVSNAESIRVSTGACNRPALTLYRQHGFMEYKRWAVGSPPLELVALRRERG